MKPTEPVPKTLSVLNYAKGEGIFVRQQGPPGHYGHVIMTVEPSSHCDLIFDWSVKEEVIPSRFSAAVFLGIEKACGPDGPFDGSIFTLTKVTVIGGSFHESDSKERSFEIAGMIAFDNAVKNAGFRTKAEQGS